MTIEQQLQEINADVDEIKRLLEQATRPRVKQFLEIQQRKFETESINLQEKQRQQQTAASAAEKTASATVLPAATRSYTKEISQYAWDQTDKFVKIYVQNLDGIGGLPENQVQCSFEKRGFVLQINNLKNINYAFKLPRLLHEIDPVQSTFKIKKDSVILSLRKVDAKNWECVLLDEKKAPEKSMPKMDETKDPGDSLMSLMKNMYDSGDDEMKRTIAKAWTESREKMGTGGGAEGSDMPGF